MNSIHVRVLRVIYVPTNSLHLVVLLLLFDWVYYEALTSSTTYKNRDKWVVVS